MDDKLKYESPSPLDNYIHLLLGYLVYIALIIIFDNGFRC